MEAICESFLLFFKSKLTPSFYNDGTNGRAPSIRRLGAGFEDEEAEEQGWGEEAEDEDMENEERDILGMLLPYPSQCL